MKKVIIVGAGDLGLQFQHMIENYSEDRVVGWIDDTKNIGKKISGVKVIGKIEDLKTINSPTTIALAIGYKHSQFKLKLIKTLKNNSFIELYSFIHPSAFVDISARLEPGVVIYPNATIDMRVFIKSGTIINNTVTVSHDTVINQGVFLAPSVTVSGNVEIGQGCFIGAGSIIKDGVNIGNFNTFGSGSNIHKNVVEKNGTYISKTNLIKLK
jgi:sugar O-acyltransferase (sialic acid O-acetyltransferase NeuD family)